MNGLGEVHFGKPGLPPQGSGCRLEVTVDDAGVVRCREHIGRLNRVMGPSETGIGPALIRSPRVSPAANSITNNAVSPSKTTSWIVMMFDGG